MHGVYFRDGLAVTVCVEWAGETAGFRNTRSERWDDSFHDSDPEDTISPMTAPGWGMGTGDGRLPHPAHREPCHCPVSQPQLLPYLNALSAKSPNTFLFVQLTEHALGYWCLHLASFGSALGSGTFFPRGAAAGSSRSGLSSHNHPRCLVRLSTQREDLCLDTTGGAGCW